MRQQSSAPWRAFTRQIGMVLAAIGLVAAASPDQIRDMRWHRRVLILSAPTLANTALIAEQRLLDGWRREASDRDLTVVELVGDEVHGASGDADKIRARYGIPDRGFQAVLIGKDGHVVITSATPVAPSDLQRRIDAMPMRRAGGR